MRRVAVILLVVGVLCFFGCSSKSDTPAEDAAVKAAQAWVSLVDSGKYEESWNETAEFFKGAVHKDGWQRSMEAVRRPLGANLSREVKSREYSTTMPGAPDGEYVVIQFESSFEYKKSAIETVAPMLDKDGKWRVAGYYIK
ncbi:MAG: DUF4019 domain-containing protein [Candidatus Eisenbacteria bacterium]